MTNQTIVDSKDIDHSKNDNDLDQDFTNNPIVASSVNNNQVNGGDVCRDFLRNTCRRGANCKFNHPEQNDPKKCEIPLLTFCHDFQNRECKRNNCKFVHCSKQDEETYKSTGKLPSSVNLSANGVSTLNNQANQNNSNNQSNNQNNSNHGNKFKKSFNNQNHPAQQHNNFKDQDVPICKDFVKNDCFRGARCKFRHVKNDAERNFNNSNNNINNNNGNNYDPFDKQYTPNSNMQINNETSNFDNSRYVLQCFDQFNHQANSIPNHTIARNDNQFQIPIDRRNSNMRSMFEPEPKRRAFDSGYNTPTTFTFANNNANNQLCVTNALGQLHTNATNGASTGELGNNSTATLATVAINDFNGAVSAATSNTITRSLYSNLNDNQFLFEENGSLRRKIEELKQQIVDLINANEFLLKQNSQLRGLMPATSVNQVTTTMHNPVSALHTNDAFTNAVVQSKPANNNPASSQPPMSHIGATTITNQTAADLLVVNQINHLHRQNQQLAAATSVAMSNPLSSNPLASAASSVSALTSTSTSTPLISYPIMTASIHSLGHLSH